MAFDPDKQHRRSIRLRGFDYSRAGLYFVTLCVQGRESLLGAVEDSLLQMNDAGRMVEGWWLKLPDKFPIANNPLNWELDQEHPVNMSKKKRSP